MTSFGRITKLELKEIKKIWPKEENDLTPWIADNIDILSKVLGLQIEIEETEDPVQNFRADLVGVDNLLEMPVIIENQFGKSDHNHLGKLITYSADKEAGVMIWIANEFHNAHVNAIEWLNNISPQDMRFFALELAVYRIDDSKPAPDFKIVAGLPLKKKIPMLNEPTEKNKRYQKFFEQFRKKISNTYRGQAPFQSFCWVAGIGIRGYGISIAFTADNKFKIEFTIDNGNKEWNDKMFGILNEGKEMIGEKIGEKLVWDSKPDRRANRIYVTRDVTIDDGEEKLNETIEWGAPVVKKFKDVFTQIVRISNE